MNTISLSTEEAIAFSPTCGQCKGFDGAMGLCRYRKELWIHDNGAMSVCKRVSGMDAACAIYCEVCPF